MAFVRSDRQDLQEPRAGKVVREPQPPAILIIPRNLLDRQRPNSVTVGANEQGWDLHLPMAAFFSNVARFRAGSSERGCVRQLNSSSRFRISSPRVWRALQCSQTGLWTLRSVNGWQIRRLNVAPSPLSFEDLPGLFVLAGFTTTALTANILFDVKSGGRTWDRGELDGPIEERSLPNGIVSPVVRAHAMAHVSRG